MTRAEIGRRKRAKVLDQIENMDLEEVLLADGLDHAILGLVELGCGQRVTAKNGAEIVHRDHVVVAYSTKAILDGLVDDGMEMDEALEHFEFNIKGAWVGPATPIYVQDELDCFSVDDA